MDTETGIIDQHLHDARTCSQQEDPEGAVRHYQAILALWDSSPQLRESIQPVRALCDAEVGDYYRELGFLDLAVHHLKRSVEWAPGRWQSYVALGRAYFAQGNFRDAQGHFQETQRLVHSEPGELTPAGQLASAAAYEHIAEIVGRNRPDGDALAPFSMQAQELYAKGGDLWAAARCRLRLCQGWGGRLDPEAVLERAQDLDALMARLALELAQRQHPQHAALAFQLAKAWAAAGWDRQAARCFLRVTQLEAPELHGSACELAADAFQRLKILPEEVQRLYQRAEQIHRQAGQEEAATRCRLKRP